MAPDNYPGYQTPILASIFRVVGVIAFLSAAFFLLVGLGGMLEGTSRGMDRGGPLVFLLAFMPTCSAICTGLFFFGIGQIMDFIGQIAFNTGRLCEFSEIQALGRGGKPPVGSIRPTPIARTKPPQPAVERSVGTRRFYYSVQEETLGPVGEPELQALANQGVITAETFICPEGGEEWHRLDEINEV